MKYIVQKATKKGRISKTIFERGHPELTKLIGNDPTPEPGVEKSVLSRFQCYRLKKSKNEKKQKLKDYWQRMKEYEKETGKSLRHVISAKEYNVTHNILAKQEEWSDFPLECFSSCEDEFVNLSSDFESMNQERGVKKECTEVPQIYTEEYIESAERERVLPTNSFSKATTVTEIFCEKIQKIKVLKATIDELIPAIEGLTASNRIANRALGTSIQDMILKIIFYNCKFSRQYFFSFDSFMKTVESVSGFSHSRQELIDALNDLRSKVQGIFTVSKYYDKICLKFNKDLELNDVLDKLYGSLNDAEYTETHVNRVYMLREKTLELLSDLTIFEGKDDKNSAIEFSIIPKLKIKAVSCQQLGDRCIPDRNTNPKSVGNKQISDPRLFPEFNEITEPLHFECLIKFERDRQELEKMKLELKSQKEKEKAQNRRLEALDATIQELKANIKLFEFRVFGHFFEKNDPPENTSKKHFTNLASTTPPSNNIISTNKHPMTDPDQIGMKFIENNLFVPIENSVILDMGGLFSCLKKDREKPEPAQKEENKEVIDKIYKPKQPMPKKQRYAKVGRKNVEKRWRAH